MSRRSLLQRAAATSALLAGPGALLAACGDDDEAATTTPKSTTGFEPSAGSEIPKATVKYGMPPFPDGSFYVIAMKNGWYDEVGISIDPKPYGRDITPNNVVQLLINGDIDVAAMNGPGIVRTMSQVPDLKMLTASDVYIATFLLASPDSGTTPVSELVAGGMGTAEAIKTAMAGVKGKGVGFNNAGSQRVFLDAVFKKYGGLSYKDVKLTVTDDAKLIQLAKGGQIQFATPDGSAQNVELLRLGWKPLVSVSDFSKAKDLPGARKLVAASLSHEGPCAKQSYYDENTETMLRFISVMYRCIDEIAKNPQLWADHSPYLKARNGIDVPVTALQTIFKDINPFTDFDHQDKFWSKLPGNYEDYTVVYGEQIKAAQEGGVLPKGETFKPEDAFLGPRVWGTLRDLQKRYDTKKKGASIKDKALAAKAQTHYDHRNYLDAVRLLTAATA